VACVEADKLGGVCLNIGCIPTKAMLTSALLVNDVKKSGEAHGIQATELSFDLGPAQERSRRVANQLSRGISGLFKKNKITHVQGYGRLQGGGAVAVENEGEIRVIHGEHIIVATGSRPRNLPSLQIDEDRIWSSTGALMQTKAPDSLLIVGQDQFFYRLCGSLIMYVP
jgi:dihydrolipoamide dehydrogenase